MRNVSGIWYVLFAALFTGLLFSGGPAWAGGLYLNEYGNPRRVEVHSEGGRVVYGVSWGTNHFNPNFHLDHKGFLWHARLLYYELLITESRVSGKSGCAAPLARFFRDM